MILGIIAGILTMCGIIPQIYKAHKTQKTGDVSKGMLVVIMIGVFLWTVYGILKSDFPIIITNAIAFLLNSYMLFIVYKLELDD
ncbi:SemiSWEET family sugar transporter [Jejudonia soesokkakensis]|uniref:SemiSWEET family sugar transporter n=1 Tax=Jejudonia soesokkakensis TaxID=1323432 RepID=A0ABW2MVW5_9FLAO